MNSDSRLDRIESKIDKLTGAMIELAKVEQRIIAVENSQSNAHERMNRHSEEVDRIRAQQIKNTQVIQLVTFMTGVLFTALVGVLSKMFF